MKKMSFRVVCLLLAIALLATFALTGCNKKSDKLIWYARLNKQAANEEVFAEVDKYVQEKIGVGVEIVVLDNYGEQIQNITAAGEDYDIVYTSTTINNYFKNAADGNLLELDELLPEHAPKLWAMFGDDIWDALRVQGKIYGVTNQQIMARGPALFIPKQNIELLGLNMDDYKEFNLDKIEEYLRAVKEATGTYCTVPEFWTGGAERFWGMEQVVGSNLPGCIYTDEKDPKVFNQYESEEFKEYTEARKRWVQEGLTQPDYAADEDLKKFADYPADKVIPYLGCTRAYQPGAEASTKAAYGVEVEFIMKAEPVLNSYGISATMTAINSDTKNPEKAVEFLELLHTDPYLFNLIAYGIEGKHYEKIGDNKIKVTGSDYAQPTWAISNLFNSYTLDTQDDDIWDQMKEINDTAKRSPVLGFVPDTESVKLEVSNANAALDQYQKVLCQGIGEDGNFDEFLTKLRDAGAETIINTVNEQLDKWKSEK